MERIWSNRFCHSFTPQMFMEPLLCTRLGLSSGNKDGSEMAPLLKSSESPFRRLFGSMF